jgi:hypothetical protein
MYGLIRRELLHVSTFTLPWAVQLCNSYETISNMGGFPESDLAVLTNTLNQNMSDIESVVSPVENAAASATQLTYLPITTPDALTRSRDFGGHIQLGISRVLIARAYLDLLAFCRPSPFDNMRLISGTGRGALALFSAFHK